MTAKKRITVVNDNAEFLDLLAEFLSEEGYDVITLPKHQGAFEQIKNTKPDIVICDLLFNNIPAGWSLLDMLYLDPETRAIPTILCSAATQDITEVVPSLTAKGILWLEKPFELEKLLEMLATLDTDSAAKMRHVRSTPTT